MDKQPEFEERSEGLGPWAPVIRGNRLNGGGGADDDYSLFAAPGALRALDVQGISRARCLIFIEISEESGSYDLPHYIKKYASNIGDPDLVDCLVLGTADYDHLLVTISLRGNIEGRLFVNVLEEGIHSGGAAGMVLASFRIVRQLLSRIDDENTGELISPIHIEIPTKCDKEVEFAASACAEKVLSAVPWWGKTHAISNDNQELFLNNTWRPALNLFSVNGLPQLNEASGTSFPGIEIRISIRTPPTLDTDQASDKVKQVLEINPPYCADVTFKNEATNSDWAAPELAPWLLTSLEKASTGTFGDTVQFIGAGGSIPFMRMLGEGYPNAQFVVTGDLGWDSNILLQMNV